jgi:hypothetical protein
MDDYREDLQMSGSETKTQSSGLTIPPPRQDRPPLRNNVFSAMGKGNTALMPLFPHLYPGAMVPAGAVLHGGPGKSYGHFFHHNSVDEVVMTFAAEGALLKTGQLFVGARVHGVDSFLKDETDPKSFAVFCITQRQVESGAQEEAITLACKECREEIFRYEFDVTPEPDASEDQTPFLTIPETLNAINKFNGDEKARTCSKCGHLNEPFPAEPWGWSNYVDQKATVLGARHVLNRAAVA